MTEVAEKPVAAEPSVPKESHRFRRARHIGRHIIAGATGLGVAAGFTYLGFRIGTDVTGPQNDSNEVMRYAGIALPTAVLGGLGILGGFYVGGAIAPDEKFPSKRKASEQSIAIQPTENELTEQTEASNIPITPEEVAQAINDGTLKRELDAASGNDPDLAV